MNAKARVSRTDPTSRWPPHRCIIRYPEHGDEQLRRPRLAAQSSITAKRRAGVIDEHTLAGDMTLAHGRRQPPSQAQ